MAKSLPRLPMPAKLPATGNGILSFHIDANGRARDINIECQSSASAGEYLKALVSAVRFQVPVKNGGNFRHQLGLLIEVTDETKVNISDFP
jgi:hypothetical protein